MRTTVKHNSNINFQIQLLNTYPISSGIGEYVSSLCKIENTRCLSLIFKKKAGRELSYPGENYYSYLPEVNEKIEFVLNAYLQKIFYFHLWKNILKNDKSIIHYTDPSILPIIRNKRSIITIHDVFAYYPDITNGGPFNVRYRYVVKNLEKFKEFSNIIAVSKKVKNDLVRNGWKNEITVIPESISEEFSYLNNSISIRKKLKLPLDKYLVLSVSTDEPRKNLQTVNKLMETIGDDFVLVRVGPKVGKSITYEHVKDNSMMNLLYNACDVFLFPTLDEGFGRPVLESMAAGLPVVLSDIEIMHEIAGEAAIFVPNNDIKLYKESIVHSIEHAKELRQRGFKQVKNFSFEIFKEKMIKYYNSVQD